MRVPSTLATLALAPMMALAAPAPALTPSSPPSSSLSYWDTSPLNWFSSRPHPLVIWHGLGDSAFAAGLTDLKQSLQEAFPGLFVHIISLEDGESADRKRTVFGDVNDDVAQVCEQVKGIPELKGGMDAIGFSQGGQFLRALVQRCDGIQVRNLVTFGSQHAGIADFPACKPADFLCRLAEGALRAGIYTDYAQSHVISAQYYRNPREVDSLKRYLEANHFLADINNEVEQNDEYKKRLSGLDTLVMLQFDEDVTVVPKRSSWFESYPEAKGNDTSLTTAGHDPDVDETIPLRQSDLYLSDRLGLRTLDKRGSLVLDVCKGPHMHIDSACQLKVFGKYVGTPKSTSSILPSAVRHGWARVLYMVTGLRATALPWQAHALVLVVGWLTLSAVFSFTVAAVQPKVARWKKERKEGRIRLA